MEINKTEANILRCFHAFYWSL